jgi:hypothetical protein
MITSIAAFMQDTERSQSYWFAFDWLMLTAIIAFSIATAWAIYRFWLTGWVNHFRQPFHLRLFAAVVGLGLFLIASGAYALEYKLHEWDNQTFLIILGVTILLWLLLLLIEFSKGKRVRY